MRNVGQARALVRIVRIGEPECRVGVVILGGENTGEISPLLLSNSEPLPNSIVVPARGTNSPSSSPTTGSTISNSQMTRRRRPRSLNLDAFTLSIDLSAPPGATVSCGHTRSDFITMSRRRCPASARAGAGAAIL